MVRVEIVTPEAELDPLVAAVELFVLVVVVWLLEPQAVASRATIGTTAVSIDFRTKPSFRVARRKRYSARGERFLRLR
jgi:hypothetical protein